MKTISGDEGEMSEFITDGLRQRWEAGLLTPVLSHLWSPDDVSLVLTDESGVELQPLPSTTSLHNNDSMAINSHLSRTQSEGVVHRRLG